MNNIKIIFFLLLFQLGFASIHAQSPTIDWQRCYGGSNSDFGKKIIEGYNNTLILAGDKNSIDGDMIYSINGYDIYLFKLDTSGSILAAGSNGGNSDDFFADVTKGIINGYFIVGTTNSAELNGYHGGADFFIARTNNNFNNQWEKCFGGSGDDRAKSIQKTSDSCFVICGMTTSTDGDISLNHGLPNTNDFWLIKIDVSGNLLWEKTYGGPNGEYANNVIETADHGFLLSGGTFSDSGQVSGNHGSEDFWVVKTDSVGNLEWQNCFGGSSLEESFKAIQIGNNYYILGSNNSNNGDVTNNHTDTSGIPSGDAWLICIDSFGNLVWERSYGGTLGDEGWDMSFYNNRLFLLCQSSSYDWNVSNYHYLSWDYWILECDIQGNVIWQSCYGGSQEDYSESILVTGNHLYATGYTLSNNGDVSGNHGGVDFWLLNLDIDSLFTSTNEIPPSYKDELSVYPNPASNILTIHFNKIENPCFFVLSDLSGREIKKNVLYNEITSIDLSDLSDGIYLIDIYSSNNNNHFTELLNIQH